MAPPPPLKKGVDFQLQTAFADHNWPTVQRLAERRHKATGDAYYEALKATAESQLDGMAERAAAAAYVDSLVRGNTTTTPDLDAVALLEWACAEAQLPVTTATTADPSTAYASTFGTLRLRWAKANPRRTKEGTACLRACLQQWDLANGQQIAALLDKASGANDRRFWYWNVLLTHMLAKQLEKAAEPAEAQGLADLSALPPRALRDEEDFLLYFRVLAAHGTPANYRARALHAKTGAAAQFVAHGRKQLFLEALGQLEATGDWEAVFALCRQALETREGAEGRPPTQACDLRIWTSFVAAAGRVPNTTVAFDTVQETLQRFTSAQLPPMYAKNTGLALLLTVFALPPALCPASGDDDDATASPRVEQLLLYIAAQGDKAAVFNDVKRFVEQLPYEEAAVLLERLANHEKNDDDNDDNNNNNNDNGRTVQRTVLLHKLRYLLLSSPATATGPQLVAAAAEEKQPFVPACKACGRPVDARRAGGSCVSCLTALATDSLRLHRQLTDDAAFLTKTLPRLDKDPRIDLTLVAVSCLFRLAGLADPRRRRTGARRWYGPGAHSARRLLQALALLDAQQQHAPDDAGLRLLLLRTLVRVGSCAPGKILERLWQPLDVKNAILDALAPLLYDRLATVAPHLFGEMHNLLAPLNAYYRTVLRTPAPVQVWEAFAAGSYSSILDMAACQQRLRRSGTRALAVVEGRRATRTWDGRQEDVEEVAITGDVTAHTPLVNPTDTGPLPSLEHADHPPLADVLALGPPLASARMHLGLLAEQFLDLLSWAPGKEYRPARAADAAAADRAYVAEKLDRLQSALHDALHARGTRDQLTAAEHAHATVVASLATMGVLALDAPSSDETVTTIALLLTTTTSMLALLRTLAGADDDRAPPTTLDALLQDTGNLHALALLREAAAAAQQTVVFLGKYGVAPKKFAPLQTAATEALAAAKAHVLALQRTLGESGWLDWVVEAVTGNGSDDNDDDDNDDLTAAVMAVLGGPAAVEDWAGAVIYGWQETVQAWTRLYTVWAR